MRHRVKAELRPLRSREAREQHVALVARGRDLGG